MMKTYLFILVVVLSCTSISALAFNRDGANVFLNELHYDNAGRDRNEAVEITGPAGMSVAGWTLVLYNGSNGQAHHSIELAGQFVEQEGGYGTLLIPVPSNALQNGPDGLALVDSQGQVVQFLSYEGNFSALDGPAQGLQSTDIGVAENSATHDRASLQLVGTGRHYLDFTWLVTEDNTFGQPNIGQHFIVDVGECTNEDTTPPFIPISDIQGDGRTSPLLGAAVTTRGVVVGKVDTLDGVEGYFVQAAEGDGDPLTSDGIYVLTDQVLVLDRLIEVKGKVAEHFGMTALQDIESIEDCGIDITIPVTTVSVSTESFDLEPFEGMLVRIEGPLQVIQNDKLLQFGEIVIGFSRSFIDTNFEGLAGVEGGENRLFVIDDGSYRKQPSSVPLFDQDQGTHRVGSKLVSVTGVLGYGYGLFRCHPVADPEFETTNPRTAPPAPLQDGLRVVGFNVLNFFTTLSKDQDGHEQEVCGPARDKDCRGAETAEEFDRQRDKIIATLVSLDADIVGLVELENTDNTTIETLVAALNNAIGSQAYDWVRSPFLGTDAIREEIIYRSARVQPVGPAHATNPADDAEFQVFKRPSLAQTFEIGPAGPKLTVVVNHFKSKGSCPSGQEDPANIDQGQGCWNSLRTQQARQLVRFIDNVKTQDESEHVLVIGDLNAYGAEDPIATLESAGLVDLIEDRLPAAERYSYYYGAYGYLDHALASSGLADKVQKVAIWHTNSDEPTTLRYNHFNYQPRWHGNNAYGASDHDPVIVDIPPLGQTPTDPLALYYKDAQGLTGNTLKSALSGIISTHRKLHYREIWAVLSEAHKDPTNTDNIVLLYSGRSQPVTRNSSNNNSDQDAWNREHVWARSHALGRTRNRGPATDAHNLWPTDASINSSRSSKDFDNGGTPHHEAPDTFSDGDSWEPRDHVKGDVARTMFYMATRYEGDSSEPDLTLVDTTDTSGTKFGKLCTLFAWHTQDAISEDERQRNNIIHQVQGNRNPFIDHPEWVMEIWGSDCGVQ